MRRFLTNILPEFDDLGAEMTKAFASLPGHHANQTDSTGQYHALLDASRINDHSQLTENALLAVTRMSVLKIIQWIIQLGLEHDIYQPHEFSDLYHVMSLACGHAADILQNTISVVIDYQESPSITIEQKQSLADKRSLLQARHVRLSAQAAFARGLGQVSDIRAILIRVLRLRLY